jgi:hypothetical protein
MCFYIYFSSFSLLQSAFININLLWFWPLSSLSFCLSVYVCVVFQSIYYVTDPLSGLSYLILTNNLKDTVHNYFLVQVRNPAVKLPAKITKSGGVGLWPQLHHKTRTLRIPSLAHRTNPRWRHVCVTITVTSPSPCPHCPCGEFRRIPRLK